MNSHRSMMNHTPGIHLAVGGGLLLALAFGLVALAFLLAPLLSETPPPRRLTPDADGKFTFHGPGYGFRVAANQLATTWTLEGSALDNPVFVALSIDRREFGATKPPGKPRVICKPDGDCTDDCEGGWSCDDLLNGWYRVHVLADARLGTILQALGRGPEEGVGFRCGVSTRASLELCWDPARVTPPWPITNLRLVSYPEVKQAAAFVWISLERDADERPLFVASCTTTHCERQIEYGGARLEITFDPIELDDWRRFDLGLHEFAERLIVPSAAPKRMH